MSRILITSALPYINGVKHLGNLVGSMLPADVHARFLRQTGDEVLFICATDEHGTPAELAAVAAGSGRRALLRRAARDPGRRLPTLRSVVRPFRPHRPAGRTAISPSTSIGGSTPTASSRSARCGRCARRSTGASCPTATSRHLPALRLRQMRAATSARTAASLLDPTDLIEPRSALSGEHAIWSCARAATCSSGSRCWRTASMPGSTPRHGWPPFVVSLAKKWLTDGPA